MDCYFLHLKLLIKRILIVIGLFSLTRIFFFLVNLGHFGKIPFNELCGIFLWGIRFDLSAIIYLNSPIILMHIIPGEFKNKQWYQRSIKILFVIINSILVLFNLADSEYFMFTKKRMSAFIFDMMGFGKVENDVIGLLPKYIVDFWYIPLVWIILMTLTWIIFPKVDLKKIKKIRVNPITYTIQGISGIIIIGLFIIIGRGGLQLKPIHIIDAVKYTNSENVPLLLNTPFTIMKTFGKSGLDQKSYFNVREIERIYTPVKKFANDSVFKKMNVVIIILESFSKEYIGSLTHTEGYTPFLDSLIRNSLTFSCAYANGTQSIEALPSILAGIPSLMDNPFITSFYSSNNINSLASILKKEGYSASLFHGATNGSMGFDNFAKAAHFDNFFGRSEYGNENDYDGEWGIFDEQFLQYAANQFNSFKKPFFSSIMTLSSHHPYKVPARYKDKFAKGMMPIHNVISYADYSLKRFFETASKMSWYNNTLFVLTADHTGPAYDGYYKRDVGRFAVPVIFFCPSDSSLRGINDSTITQQSAIMPSVLDYLGYNKFLLSFGESVFSGQNTSFAVNYLSGVYQLIEKNYVILFDGNKNIGLFNLKNDPLLRANLMDTFPGINLQMEKKIKAIIQQYNNRLIDNRLVINN